MKQKHLPELDPSVCSLWRLDECLPGGCGDAPGHCCGAGSGPHFCAPHEDPRNTPNGTGGLPLCRAVCEVSFLWSVGGFRIYICGCSPLAQRLKSAYTLTGERKVDAQFAGRLRGPHGGGGSAPGQCPKANETARPIGGHLEGCRIGFDAGGSDRKVSAVVDGQTVYSDDDRATFHGRATLPVLHSLSKMVISITSV